jgi:HD superfamily phosphohydrolase
VRSAADLNMALKRLDSPEEGVYKHFDHGIIRVPGKSILYYGQNIRKLTDTAKFQRLRGIHQLGLAYLVFPGATHTRFEHSLGVFDNTLRILERLVGSDGDYRFRSAVSDEEIAGTVIAALFHDVGHYPFSHQLRFADPMEPHEKRALEVVKSPEVKGAITSVFNKDVFNATRQILELILAHEVFGFKTRAAGTAPKHTRVLRDIVSSTTDADKLDYLQRDSYHTGVPYGMTVDQDRFLTSVRIWWSSTGEPDLVLSSKGRASAEALVFARYLMTSEVYWNHCVRAYAAMLCAAAENLKKERYESHLWDTDHSFLQWLRRDKRARWAVDLIDSRRPYRRAFVHQKLGGPEGDETIDRRLFQVLETAANERGEKLQRIKHVVRTTLRLKDNGWAHDIVLDVPEGMTHIGGVRVLPEGHEEPGSTGRIFNAIADSFDGFARKARIFVHPDLMTKKSVLESTREVREALLKEFNIA